jgi:hypothetical protein
MRKIFYDPETLEIKGMTDGGVPFQFPHVETDVDYHSTENLSIVPDGEGVALNVDVAVLPEDEPEAVEPLDLSIYKTFTEEEANALRDEHNTRLADGEDPEALATEFQGRLLV